MWSCGGGTTNSGDQFFAKSNYAKATEAYSELLVNNPSDVSLLYNRGRSYEELGNFDLAEQDFLAILGQDAKHLNACLSLSKVYYEMESYNKAVIFADRALDVNQNSAQGHFLSARAKHQLGYVDSALESYNLAININKDMGEAYLYRGALKMHMGNSKSACSDITKAVNLDIAEAKTVQSKYCN
ncbi:MAG: tetratricopeptide (TPR) repeat protein [Marinoscillum sp.]|jgi:tetratricopeptide (TPR) repeat protein